jgi:hypothetical protein
MSLGEKRISTRHKLDFFVDVFHEGSLFSDTNKIINISLTGCLLKLSSPLNLMLGQVVLIKIQEHNLKNQYGLELDLIGAEVIRRQTNPINELALRFLTSSKKNDDFLNYLLINGLIARQFPMTWQVSRNF